MNHIYSQAKQHQSFSTIEEMNLNIRKFLYTHAQEINDSISTILKTISHYACKVKGVAWIGVPELIKVTGYSDSTIRRATRFLAKMGIVKKIKRTRKRGGDGSNYYVIQPLSDLLELPCDKGDDRAQMTGRETQEKPCPTRNEEKKKKAETKSFKALIKKNIYNKQSTKSNKPKSDKYNLFNNYYMQSEQTQENKYDVFNQYYQRQNV